MKTLLIRYANAILFIVCLFSFSTAYSQNVTISGTVKDPSGQPLAGASVQLQGARGGTVTDNNGSYSLNAASW